jgi:thiamine pyrophosphate-dependent acetolactate synthase large subunit-like protein
MTQVTGSQLVAEQLRREGVDTLFFIMGGPIIEVAGAAEAEGIRIIDVRHEQAAAMAAHAYARATGRPGVCLAASGPATTNLLTGIANAYTDAAPVIALGGASATTQFGMDAFQEFDQVGCFRPVTRWAERALHTARLPEMVNTAFRHALGQKPGPVYLDLPGDVLYRTVERERVHFPPPARPVRAAGDPAQIELAVDLLRRAERPIIVAGSGVLWSGAEQELAAFVDRTGIPFFTTPQARGAVPEDHELCFLGARSAAFQQADTVLLLGTRTNFIIGHALPPRFAADAKFIMVNSDATEIGHNRAIDAGIVGDAKLVLGQMLRALDGFPDKRRSAWVDFLRQTDAARRERAEAEMATDQVPIHPMRLCREVRDVLDRDAILIEDGHEILNMARQTIPSYVPRARLNAGPNGCMGVCLPFALGAKAAQPGRQVVALCGDGSFGMNVQELDTAVRHNLPFVAVISHNGGWTGAIRGRKVPGRDLRMTRYDEVARAFGCYGEYVERPEEIRPAIERALASGRPAVVNVVTDPYAKAKTQPFGSYSARLD